MATFEQIQAQLRDAPAPAPVDSKFSDIASYFALPSAAPVSNALAGAAGKSAGAQVKYDQNVKDYQRGNEINSLQAQQRNIRLAADQAGKKNKYQQVVNGSGGFDFYDPNGNKVTPFEYAQATGQSIGQALSGSLDPNQANFVEDYKSALDLGDVVQKYASLDPKYKTGKYVQQTQKQYQNDLKNKGQKAADAALTPEQKAILDYVDNATANPDLIKQTPQDLMKAIIQTHPGVFKADSFRSPVTGQAGGAIPTPPPSLLQQAGGAVGGLFNKAVGALRGAF